MTALCLLAGLNAGCVFGVRGGGGLAVSHDGATPQLETHVHLGAGDVNQSVRAVLAFQGAGDHLLGVGGLEGDQNLFGPDHLLGLRLRAEAGELGSFISTGHDGFAVGLVPGVFWSPFNPEGHSNHFLLSLEVRGLFVEADNWRAQASVSLFAEWLYDAPFHWGG